MTILIRCVSLSHCHVESNQAAGVEVRGRATVLPLMTTDDH